MLPSRKHLVKGLYRAEGPARLKVVEGGFYALGRVFEKGDALVVPRGIVTCIEVDAECIVEGVIGGSLSEARPEEEVIGVWRELSEEVVSRGGRVVVVGEVDSGKTTFSTFLVNTALSRGLKVAFIDADVGQNDVGYPGTIALAVPTAPLSWLGELEPLALYFVGSNTPSGCEDAVILGLCKLLRRAESYDVVVVNTDGWVADRRARMYKARLIEAVMPDTLVVMEGTGASEPLARMFETSRIQVVRAPTPPGAKGKERELRKMRRELAYLDLLRKSAVRRLDVKAIRFWGVCSLNGGVRDEKLESVLSSLLGVEARVEVCGGVMAVIVGDERSYRTVLDAKRELVKLVRREVVVTNLGRLKGLLVGLLDEELECVGVGVVEEVEPHKGYVKLRTPVSVDRVRLIVPGQLRISEEGVERERGLPPLA
ncbi:MAG: hypothetical protein DRJ96_00010 [Thermoprotei archaeon]|nr:MAG: hypothetical protein DRJ67_05050 [Thermoprotei archaeon]RLE98757.1 MAG: hypothetical protein DRJ96_00010 [Thermoprotei archaeon]